MFFITWLTLTIIGVALTFMSLILDIGIGHGDPGWLSFLVGTATLIVPFLVADRMKQSKDLKGEGPTGSWFPAEITIGAGH